MVLLSQTIYKLPYCNRFKLAQFWLAKENLHIWTQHSETSFVLWEVRRSEMSSLHAIFITLLLLHEASIMQCPAALNCCINIFWMDSHLVRDRFCWEGQRVGMVRQADQMWTPVGLLFSWWILNQIRHWSSISLHIERRRFYYWTL